MAQQVTRSQPSDLKEFMRNNYFYGKLLDVFHLELETNYFNAKRWMLNRLVTGCGVVCGLNVELTEDGNAVEVHPGVAIDCCGREIVVAQKSRSGPLPALPEYPGGASTQEHTRSRDARGYCREEYVHVALCYRECEADPVPVLGGDCEPICAAGSIRERYEIKVRKGYVPGPKSSFPDVIEGRWVNHKAIVDYVTRRCPPMPEDCCIPLANILLRDSGTGWEPEVDIYVRRIVYTNRLLFGLILSMAHEESE